MTSSSVTAPWIGRLWIAVAFVCGGLTAIAPCNSPALGQTTWTGASGDQNWSTGGNWDSSVPGSGDTAVFDDTTGGADGVVTNVVDGAFGGEIGTLRYTLRSGNENSFFHTTEIAPGAALLLTTALEVAPNDFNMPGHRTVDVTIAGGAGSGLQVGTSGTRTANVLVAYNPDDPSGRTLTGNLDLSGLESFAANVNTFRVADGHRQATGTVTLAQTNTIDANSIVLSRASGNNAGTVNLLLGQDNTITANGFIVGGNKSQARVVFAAAGGTLDLGTASARTDLYLGRQTVGTSGGASGVVDLSGGTFNAYLDVLALGTKVGSGASGASGTTSGELTMDAGSVDVNTLQMALRGTIGTANATLNIRGGTFNVNDAVTHGGGTSTINLDEGTMTVGSGFSVDNLRVGLADADGADATLTVNGGAVRIGSAGASTLDVGLRTDSFPANAPASAGVLDLAAATGVTIDVADVRLGVIVGTPSNEGITSGDLILSQSGVNSITANSILAGDSSARGNQVTNTIQLGANANTISTDKLTLGGQKSSATLTVAADGTLTLEGKSGDDADLDLGYNVTSNTGAHSSGIFDMSGGTLNATLGQVRLGQHNIGVGSGSGTLIFDAGMVNAASVAMGLGNGNSSGTITMSGGTFNVSGNVTDGGGTSNLNVEGGSMTVGGDLIVDSLIVGRNGRNATLAMTGTSAQLGSAANPTDLYVGRRDANTGTTFQGTLDLSGVTTLTAHLKDFLVGTAISAGTSQGQPRGVVTLADQNAIYADNITIGYSPAVGLGGFNNRIILGTENTIMTQTLTVGGSKGAGVLDFQAPGGTLNLGTDADRVDMFIGNQSVWTSGGSVGTADLSGGIANAFLGELVVGSKAGNATGTTRGTFTMTDGVVDANAVILARREDTGGVGAIYGTVNLQGGWLKAGSIGGSPVNPNTASDQLNFHWTGGRLSADQFGFDLLQTSTASPSVLAPGRSIGTTSIDGSYTMDTGTLEIEIAGTGTRGIDYDFVMVEGDASLAGYLDAVLLGGFLPKMGDYFDVLHSTTGMLDIEDLTPPAGHPNPGFGWWEIATVPGPARDGLTLRLSAVPEPGTWLLLLAAGICGLLVRRRR